MTAPFKYTITVEKAEQTDEGLFIEGVASGMGVDSQGHEMDPAAIVRFEKQIAARNEAGDPIPYLDWHNDKSVLAELGHVVKATINDDWSMRIRVRLDEDNPAAVALHRKVQKGKQYGMSVKGEAMKFARVINDAGQSVLRLFDVVLTEVSNTTKPVWTPSLGTVIAKAVIDEADAESVIDGGDNPEMSKDDTKELQPGVTEGAPADENPAPEDTTAAAESEDGNENAVEVEKAGAKYSKKAKDNFLAMYKQMGDMLRAEGILDEEDESVEVKKAEGDDAPAGESADAADKTTAQSDDEPDSAESPETPDADASAASDDAKKGADAEPTKSDREKELEAALAEMTARAEAAEAKAKSPQMVVTPESTSPAEDERTRVTEAIKALPREQRLAAALELADAARGRKR